MNSKITLVTPPDDVINDAFRILLVSLDKTQSDMLSSALYDIKYLPDIVLYVYNPGDDTNWLFDKKLKSNLIFFDAEANDQALIGYLTAQRHSYHFGEQKTLSKISNRAVYDKHSLVSVIEGYITDYE